MEITINEYENLIYKRAYYFHSFNHEIPFEDLYQEGRLAFFYAKEKFNPKKGIKFITFFWMVLNQKLIQFIGKWKRFNVDNLIEIESNPPGQLHIFNRIENYWNTFSSETREVIQLILSNPFEFCEQRKHVRKNQKRLREMIGESMTKNQITAVFQEIKGIL